ncbi:MAG: hypothetical protein NVS1B6_10590 [Steroidobacteraceae bacterium]
MAPRPPFRNVAILGTGLIGTSIGLALKAQRPAPSVVGWDKKRNNLAVAMRRKAVDRGVPTMRAALADADCVVIALPLEQILRLLPQVLRLAHAGSLIIDTSSVKTPVMALARKLGRTRPDVRLAGGHPVAGSERNGPSAADAQMFRRRPFAICLEPPPAGATDKRLLLARRFARALGAQPILVDARHHDGVMAAVSALPQLVAGCIALTAGGSSHLPSIKTLAGPGYQGATRLALSPFAVWKMALRSNARNVRQALAVFENRVREIRRALEKRDDRAGRAVFAAAAAARRATVASGKP